MQAGLTKQRLEDFAVIMTEYGRLLEKKRKIMNKLGLKGVDYSKDRVTSGAAKSSEQERFVMALQKVNADIAEYEAWIAPEKAEIKGQLCRIKEPRYRKIIVLRYIDRWKWSEIVQEFFWYEPDFEEQKFLKYKDNVMYWHRRALEEVEKLSGTPFVPVQRHLI